MQDAATYPQAREELQRSCALYNHLEQTAPHLQDARCQHAAALAESATLARWMHRDDDAAALAEQSSGILDTLEQNNPSPTIQRRIQMVRDSLKK